MNSCGSCCSLTSSLRRLAKARTLVVVVIPRDILVNTCWSSLILVIVDNDNNDDNDGSDSFDDNNDNDDTTS